MHQSPGFASDSKFSYRQENLTGGGLDAQVRSERRLPPRTDLSTTQLSAIQLEDEGLRVRLPAVRAGLHASIFFKALHPVVSLLREREVRLVIYPDVILIMHQGKASQVRKIGLVLGLFEAG